MSFLPSGDRKQCRTGNRTRLNGRWGSTRARPSAAAKDRVGSDGHAACEWCGWHGLCVLVLCADCVVVLDGGLVDGSGVVGVRRDGSAAITTRGRRWEVGSR